MVVVKLMQGLGNQMFQYAVGRSLSLHLNTPLKVNIDNYGPNSLRQYELSKFFLIEPGIVTAAEMQQFNLSHPVRRIWNKFFPSKKIRSLPYEETSVYVRFFYQVFYLFRKPHLQKVYEERHSHYDSHFFKAKPPVFLKGYWHSYRYFENYKEQLKKDFTVRPNLVAHLSSIANEIKGNNSIALHVRCTDKLSATHLKLHGKLSPAYYRDGIEHVIAQTNKDVCLYVFTDDMNAAKEYIPDGYKTVWVSNVYTKNAIEDFYLMQLAKSIVISNSTFSWWAAYLNVHNAPIVVVPANWYNDAPYNPKDIYCPHWIKK